MYVCLSTCNHCFTYTHTYHYTLGVFSLAVNAHAPHAAAHGGTDFDNQILAHIAGSIGQQQQQRAKILVSDCLDLKYQKRLNITAKEIY